MLNEDSKVPDSSESAEWQKLTSKLRPLAIEMNTSIVWLHHANKSTGTSTGSIGITAAVDAIVTITPTRKPNRRMVTFLGRRVNASSNCALDYLDEERGYEVVKDWKQSEQETGDQKNKAERTYEWLCQYVVETEGDCFERPHCAQAYTNEFHESHEVGKSFKNALKRLCDEGAIKQGSKQNGNLTYDIINRDLCGTITTKPSDLTGDSDDR